MLQGLCGECICSTTLNLPNFEETRLAEVHWRKGEVRLGPGPMGEHFSGSCTLTSRNSSIGE
jgi:hypothetical protein